MSEKEKAILENLSKSLSKATDSQKEYLLGLADGLALANAKQNPTRKKSKPNNK